MDVQSVIDEEKSVSIQLSDDASSKLKGDELFIEVYRINENFKLNYKNDCIYVILEKKKLKKHYLMYLIALLIKIKEMIK